MMKNILFLIFLASRFFLTRRSILFFCAGLIALPSYSQTVPDVLSYELTLEPNLQSHSIKGSVQITLEVPENTQKITLNASTLEILEVSGTSVTSYNKKGSKLWIELTPQVQHHLTIEYKGSPTRGLLFDPEKNEAHTVYFTDQWMVCNNKPNDRATFTLNLLLPKSRQSIASGNFLGREERGEKVLHSWQQNYETPAYTYGFVIGSFTRATEQVGEVKLHYYASELNETQLRKVFVETPAILKFFEERSGIPYVQDSYSQILIGENYQEMSGLSVLAEAYPTFVLKDSSEIHLTSHELAHQWWGNGITCKTFSHFWLNEALAVYMSSAFSEHRFGEEKYKSDISIYKSIYDDLVKRGVDRPLVFKEWRATRDNRNVVYYKGAYVLHLLREELGEEDFWKGIRQYSKSYFGRSVTTRDFQSAMETASNKDLGDFFTKWVYGPG